jgi:hypothetical protein
LKIKALVKVTSNGGRLGHLIPNKESVQEIEFAQEYTKDELEAELRKVEAEANKKIKSMHLPMMTTMQLLEINGVPI